MKTFLIFFLATSVLASPVLETINLDNFEAVAITTRDGKSTQNMTAPLRDVLRMPEMSDQVWKALDAKLSKENEIAAQKHIAAIKGIKGIEVQIPKDMLDKHNARIAKFAKAKEDALNGAVKKAIDTVKTVKIDVAMSQDDIAVQMEKINQARALAIRAKSKKDELIAAGIPISKPTVDAVEAIIPKQPSPKPTAIPAPDDGL